MRTQNFHTFVLCVFALFPVGLSAQVSIEASEREIIRELMLLGQAQEADFSVDVKSCIVQVEISYAKVCSVRFKVGRSVTSFDLREVRDIVDIGDGPRHSILFRFNETQTNSLGSENLADADPLQHFTQDHFYCSDGAKAPRSDVGLNFFALPAPLESGVSLPVVNWLNDYRTDFCS